jgi:tetraacyldisaccharide 4'-kinase
MSRAVLFVTNGHGEAAIASRIAQELRALAPLRTDHLALVGEALGGPGFDDVGPQRAMPSGGLVAMGNVRAFARDVGAGFFALFARQLAFLRAARERYVAIVAVGDAFACAMARAARIPLVFVGTAKSVYVARYGPGERRVLRGARRIFVRDAATASDLRAHGVPAEAPGNVIVDLLAAQADRPKQIAWHAPLRLALLPGSRERAYGDALRLASVVAFLRERRGQLDAVLSVAPNLDARRFAPALERGGLRLWDGPLGPLLSGATLAIGQSGTANEAAAAQGVPVVALALENTRREGWYRRRQQGLLGEALLVVSAEAAAAASAIDALLDDGARCERMSAVGRERMGAPGGARKIAEAIAGLAA